MRLKKRCIVRIISFTTAIFGVLIVRNCQLMNSEKLQTQTINYNYSRAIEDLANSCDNLSSTLEKQLYAGSGKMHQSLAIKLYREAVSAKSALAQLPITQLQLENTYKFLSQVGNYSLSISEKLMNGEEISNDEYENISSLYDFSKELSEDIWELENAVASGEVKIFEVLDSSDEENPPEVTNGFMEFEEGFSDYPSLIYDGPFSDNILEKTPQMTKDKNEITQTEALQKASISLNMNSTDLSEVSEVAGKMPAWRFSNKDSTVSCEVTKQGGYLSYFLKSRIVNNISISNDYALECGQKCLDELGIISMTTTYYAVEGNVMTINYAYKDLDKCIYTDLVKVSVAMDNGEILGYDARGFLVNHKERSYPQTLYPESRAEEKISPRLDIKSHQLAVIPTENLDEVLCYEFKCKSQNDRNVLVYINAETGEEEDILMLVESDWGTLTI